ncbi:MAG: Crp/Fnr family transcriptional regulator [Mongoliibacter sp.]|uniref:Crp/Fnr family transcriptional regulator n=1 Tax=Mongoliibacter sp. TaxID=2022438 RepID=UPI0012F46139|nr:Crp/Fnr family transcriptional regulator [Mongoliibacter sp.]TVP44759.1 MAG: Crp/Fnr family transcriptional regulator [Mongoliibacter sp.]
MSKLTETLQKFVDLEEKSLKGFLEKGKILRISKSEKLIKAGEICETLFFILEGSVRSFYFKDDKDVTISFSLEEEFITSMSSFITQKPSYENIEALEDCELWAISHKDLMETLARYRDLEYVYRQLLEEYYIRLEEQLIFSKFKTAKERYLELIKNKPKIIQKASVGQIASFLDMSIETLSRIRASL